MKKLCFCYVLVFTLSCSSNAEPIVAAPDSKTKPAVVIPKAYDLTREQSQAWRTIEQEWLKTEYPKILLQQKLKMNCSGCENIYMDAIFTIDAQGRLKRYELVNSKKCADKFSKVLAARFTDWFFAAQFPPVLRELSFEVRLGTGLSC
jgi:hypothetical protein